MLKRILILLIAFSGYVINMSAQDTIPDQRQARVKAKADERYEQYSFSPAIDIYKKVLDKGYVSSDLLKRLGNSYYFNAKYKEAADIYKRLQETYPDEMEVEDIFRYAQSLKTLGEYGEASRLMTEFKQMTAVD